MCRLRNIAMRVTTVPTGKKHIDPESTSPKSRELLRDINTKLGFGMLSVYIHISPLFSMSTIHSL